MACPASRCSCRRREMRPASTMMLSMSSVSKYSTPGRRLRRQSLRQVVSVDGLVQPASSTGKCQRDARRHVASWTRGGQDLRRALHATLRPGALYDQREPPRSLSSEPPTFVTKTASGERGNLPGLVRSMFCTTSLEPKLKVCDVFSRDLEPNHQGKSLTVTSFCDFGKACHLGLYLRHAVIAQGVALPLQAHACTKFHHCFPSFSTVKDS